MTSTPDVPQQLCIVDDKSPVCIPFILDRLAAYQKQQKQDHDHDHDHDQSHHHHPRPFLVGINGVQGIGKTTLVSALAETLQSRQGLETLIVSIDDFYLSHADQRALAAAQPDNGLVQVRGEPGTHDTQLLAAFFDAICAGAPTRVPQYDKAAFFGQGDRIAPSASNAGRLVNGLADRPLQVVILEGWCVGFRPADPAVIEAKWKTAVAAAAAAAASPTPVSSQLHKHKLEHLLFVNSQLAAYDSAVTRRLDAFIHLDAQQTPFVYAWRREQEAALRRDRGSGMTDDQVDRFVDAYYPAYELFSDGVRQGLFLPDRPGCQLRLVVGRDRRVQETVVL
ncbi:uridine/cytidine kinase [Grosmannia clavigera kw1407]|uniref:Uridine/cytidine kinase n=1 Tax=Grosmannia clavigera (strain kw1407 / UAMH 11150) TaxID=655863 RepID=F0XGU2_GROCL|nr:uridine/cytidine kinase [Grosmannia clavigera kw1407]EFX02840.1 uridine/cytidine kinase [Grosmannia clavigera kw1407]